jgi:hypothetical protein
VTVKRATFFPYAFASEALSLEIAEVRIDRRVATRCVDREHRAVALHEARDWATAQVTVMCSGTPELAAALLPDPEGASPEWRCHLLALCSATRLRQAVALEGSSHGPWSGTLALARYEVFGPVRIESVLSRGADARQRPTGRAFRMGARLATSARWTVQADEPRAAPGRYLSVRWEDFASSAIPALRDHADQVFFLEVSIGAQAPVLWLNSGIEELQAVLDSKGTHGACAAVRNALFDSIAQPVWMSLLMAAVEAIDEQFDEATDPAEAPLGEGWHVAVLESRGSVIYRDLDERDAAHRLAKELRDPGAREKLIPRLSAAVQRQVDLAKSTRGLLAVLGNGAS